MQNNGWKPTQTYEEWLAAEMERQWANDAVDEERVDQDLRKVLDKARAEEIRQHAAYIQELSDEATSKFYKKHADSPTLSLKVCECGAKHTSFPDSHLSFCPMKN
jgi:hypothetical protein